MYQNIDLSSAENAAVKFVMENDRMLFRPFFETAEIFCADRMIIGGRVGVDLLVGRGLSPESFMWDLYADDAYRAAKELTLALSKTRSPHIPAETATLRTDIKHKEFTILVFARMLFKVYAMEEYRGRKLSAIMGMANRSGLFTNTLLKCIPEEIVLISIYRNLYTPSRVGSWPDAIENEQKIYDLIRDSLAAKATSVVGGKEHHGRDRLNQHGLTKTILELARGDYILCGDYALSKLGIIDDPNRIQLITAIDIEQICKELTRRLGKTGPSLKITNVKYKLNIPGDFQTRKHTIYASINGRQTALADIFNSPVFEMIPFKKVGNYKVANLWVILRFIFIDVWVLKLILNITGDAVQPRIHSMLARADSVRKIIYTDLLSTFQLTNYMGNFLDEFVAKKKLIKDIGDRVPNYYPAREISGGQDGIKSARVDLSIDVETKKQILMKIVGKSDDDLMKIISEFSVQSGSRWGIGKNLKSFFYKNSKFLPFLPRRIDTFVDIGCGDGMDIVALRTRIHVRTAICADVEDFRAPEYKNSKFVQVRLGEPLDIPDNTADVVAVFHSIHHMNECIENRLGDIIRITRPGGIIMIKDHDVTDLTRASNVDFEHLVYMAASTTDLPDLIENFGQHEPMTYYSAKFIDSIMTQGCKKIWYGDLNPRTSVYGAVYVKI